MSNYIKFILFIRTSIFSFITYLLFLEMSCFCWGFFWQKRFFFYFAAFNCSQLELCNIFSIILSAWYDTIHLILRTLLGKYFYFPHFIDKKLMYTGRLILEPIISTAIWLSGYHMLHILLHCYFFNFH